VSDLSGEEIQEGKGATVTIKFADARRGTIVLDVTDEEADANGSQRSKAGTARPPPTLRLDVLAQSSQPVASASGQARRSHCIRCTERKGEAEI
jgi:hypothetical protein